MTKLVTKTEDQSSPKKIISLIVIVYNMAREAPRTLFTLTPEYQEVDPELYEVLVLDNGSTPPLGKQLVESMSENFRYIYLDDAPPSPSFALNKGANLAKGKLLGFMIDGARMLSPGVLNYALRAYKAYEHPAIVTLGFHLGKKQQQDAVLEGYDQKEEDRLLDSVPWRENGYELFKISCLAGSSRQGWFGNISESNCIFIKESDWDLTDGFDESFDLPGGGYANLDYYRRVCTNPTFEPVLILGEGNFHQFHDGSTTGKRRNHQKKRSKILRDQYSDIRTKKYTLPSINFQYMGHMPDSASDILDQSINFKQQTYVSSSFKAKLTDFLKNHSAISKIYSLFSKNI